MLDWVGGCDVGKVNLAIAFMEKSTRIVRKLYLINLCVFQGQTYELGLSSYGRMVAMWVGRLSQCFARCSDFGIEQQPGNGQLFCHIIQAHLESAIRCSYPHLNVLLISPRTTRIWAGTSGEGIHPDNKKASIDSGIVGEEDLDRMRALFRKPEYNKRKHTWTTAAKIDDVVEASILALYLAEHLQEDSNTTLKAIKNAIRQPGAFEMSDVQLYSPSPRVIATNPKKRAHAQEPASQCKRTKL